MSSHRRPVVSCRHLTRTFGAGGSAHAAVLDVSVDLYAGQRVALVGRSGSGKSTLLHLLAGLDRPDGGAIEWAAGPPDAGGRARPGIVFQAPSLIGSLTVLENVELPLLAAGVSARHARELATAALTDLDLAGYTDRLPDELSGGQAQRVATARALAGKPPLLLADEPTGQLDSDTAGHVIDVLLTAARLAGAALLIATHDPAVAARLDQTWPITDGHLTPQPTTSPVERSRP